MILRRILANIIDIASFFAIVVVAFIFLNEVVPENFFGGAIIFISIIAASLILQYPFLVNDQTVGKAFFGLKLVSTNENRPLNISIILQRDLFGKVFTCYFLCLPVIFGKKGGHEEMSSTEVRKT